MPTLTLPACGRCQPCSQRMLATECDSLWMATNSMNPWRAFRIIGNDCVPRHQSIRWSSDRCCSWNNPSTVTSALQEEVKQTIQNWDDAPPIIIDESDAELESLPRALNLGYAGTSHKNCKGIIKSVAALGTIQHSQPKYGPLILSAEDLGNIGPIALLQDLAVVAALGINHVERNGHHYFAGLKMFPSSIQDTTAKDHPDLYQPKSTWLRCITTSRRKITTRFCQRISHGSLAGNQSRPL